MVGAGTALLVVLAVWIGGGLLLHALVRREHDARHVTDRETGERRARRDSEEE